MRSSLQTAIALLGILLVIAQAHESWADSAMLSRDTAPPTAQDYSFDIEAGAELQAETSNEPATSLEFTTEAGVPYSQPYDYQRIGSDGR